MEKYKLRVWKSELFLSKMISVPRLLPEELMNIDKLLADKYFYNFSLFQSLSDSWAIPIWNRLFYNTPSETNPPVQKYQGILLYTIDYRFSTFVV